MEIIYRKDIFLTSCVGKHFFAVVVLLIFSSVIINTGKQQFHHCRGTIHLDYAVQWFWKTVSCTDGRRDTALLENILA